MKVDYIIVGLGLAGLSLIEELIFKKKSFIVFEDNSQFSSKVAGGMFNPVILKRFTAVWNAKEQLEKALLFFNKLELKFSKKYVYNIKIYRLFNSIEEQNNWFIASDKPLLNDYMCTKLVSNLTKNINAPFGFGLLNGTGRIDVSEVLKDYTNWLSSRNLIFKEKFNYNNLCINENNIIYNNIEATKIVFCEGYGIKQNPFFNYLPLKEVKGELLIIHAPELKIDYILKSAVSIMPIGNDLYKVGATFNWKDKTSVPTEEGKEELITKLKSIITVSFTIKEQVAGIRPTVIDRRPLLGAHAKHKNMFILNGLGTRGVMLGPLMAKKIVDLMENDLPLDREIDIKRFENN